MSHEAVQEVLERTLADESFRARLHEEPEAALAEYELNDEEVNALRSLYVETEVADTAELDRRHSKKPFWLLDF